LFFSSVSGSPPNHSRWRWLDRIIMPVLDLMQTIPVFAYLVPILVLFGFGPTAAIIAT
jgi:glycine betaine/proline transport system permease protein